MLIDKSGNITLITQERATIAELVNRMNDMYNELQHDHIIFNLSSLDSIELNSIVEFLDLSNRHRNSNHSFVIVTEQIDFDLVPDELVVVPTLQEAYDIIEMEEIERDLGF
ncbi:MAG: ribonuclease Z [Bacteroidia bacterium]|nr:ribonuclease Z [Bacteroidia bacterium]MBT8268522.1 ribonuclease Z [Bacteroidia bacterium]NNF82461.1 ribonuclease Z [Flavobacteriaceae bacterium]NNK70683.1 ribonuclease Z [Flavobacteriaceae bacterium]